VCRRSEQVATHVDQDWLGESTTFRFSDGSEIVAGQVERVR
jgi:hypothetical protein